MADQKTNSSGSPHNVLDYARHRENNVASRIGLNTLFFGLGAVFALNLWGGTFEALLMSLIYGSALCALLSAALIILRGRRRREPKQRSWYIYFVVGAANVILMHYIILLTIAQPDPSSGMPYFVLTGMAFLSIALMITVSATMLFGAEEKRTENEHIVK